MNDKKKKPVRPPLPQVGVTGALDTVATVNNAVEAGPSSEVTFNDLIRTPEAPLGGSVAPSESLVDDTLPPTQTPVELDETRIVVEKDEHTGKKTISQKVTFGALVGNARVTLDDSILNAKFRPHAPRITATILIGIAAWLIATIVVITFNLKPGNFSVEGLLGVTLMAGVVLFGFTCIAVVAVVWFDKQYNDRLQDRLNEIGTTLNNRYGSDLDYLDVYDLVHGERIPMNVSDTRSDVKISVLRGGRDARLVFCGTGKELPHREKVEI